LTDLTKPNETISRVKPGYLTDLSASRIWSSETDIAMQIYAQLERSKTRKGFDINVSLTFSCHETGWTA
jgi:hypothetical protein